MRLRKRWSHLRRQSDTTAQRTSNAFNKIEPFTTPAAVIRPVSKADFVLNDVKSLF